MLSKGTDRAGRRILVFGNELPPPPPADDPSYKSDWTKARPGAIRKALDRASALPAGGWYVLDASRRIGESPIAFQVAGQELVAWRWQGELRVAPNSCPHMGAPLSAGRVQEGRLVCPWHGLELGEERHGKWERLDCYEDGVLSWVRLDAGEALAPRPTLPERPAEFIDGVIRVVARCEPVDVIANRLDPWHGAWFHFHSFARLRVLDETEDKLTVRVAFRVLGPVCVEVDCTFHCPDSRTIVMTIVEGEGAGSVVETHATPMAPGWTAIVEATLANSERTGFQVVRRLSPLLRPLVERTARRLWVEDAAYAERTYHLRQGGAAAPGPDGDWSAPPGTPRPR